jgi:hypothetical protein
MKMCDHKKIETTHYLLCVKCQMKWEKTLKLNEKEVKILVDLMESEWVRFLENGESDLLEKLRKFLEAGE